MNNADEYENPASGNADEHAEDSQPGQARQTKWNKSVLSQSAPRPRKTSQQGRSKPGVHDLHRMPADSRQGRR